MSLKSDCGGTALVADIKLSKAGTTWNTRLSQIGRLDGLVTLCTFSAGDIDYLSKILSKRTRGSGIRIIGNEKCEWKMVRLKYLFPDAQFFVSPYAHAKLALVEPATVWVSSENLGRTRDVFDASIGIHSEEAYQHYLSQVESLLRRRDTREIKEV